MAKVVFMGSPAFAVPSLQALYDAGHEIIAVYTQPPRPAGRGQKLQPTDVHILAETLGLTVLHPAKLRGEALDALLELEFDVCCVVAYGLLLPKQLVDTRLCLNVHPSRLPRWRGAAPLQWTLIAGDTSTDVCVMKLDEGMDTGPVALRESMAVPPDWNLAQLHDATAKKGAAMLAEVVDNLKELELVPQVGEATHAAKMTKEMRRIDWSKSATDIHNLVRGIYPMAQAALGDEIFKVLTTEVDTGFHASMMTIRGIRANEQPVIALPYRPGEVVRIDEHGILIACGEGYVRLINIQRAGGKLGKAHDIAHGWHAFDDEAILC